MIQRVGSTGGAPFRTDRARQRRLEKRNAHRQKLRQRFAEVAAKQLAKKQLARVSLPACWMGAASASVTWQKRGRTAASSKVNMEYGSTWSYPDWDFEVSQTDNDHSVS